MTKAEENKEPSVENTLINDSNENELVKLCDNRAGFEIVLSSKQFNAHELLNLALSSRDICLNQKGDSPKEYLK